MNSKRRRSTYPAAKAERLSINEAAAKYGVDCEVVNVREAKDQLSRLLECAAKGKLIVVTSDGRPKAMIVRYRPYVQGAAWASRRLLRRRMPMSEDSTPLIREMRDTQN
jgi:prevent-host-death family protein